MKTPELAMVTGVARVTPFLLKILLLIVPVSVNGPAPFKVMFAPMFSVAPNVRGAPILKVVKSRVRLPLYAPPVPCRRVVPCNVSEPLVVVIVPLFVMLVGLMELLLELALVNVAPAAMTSVPAPLTVPLLSDSVPVTVRVMPLGMEIELVVPAELMVREPIVVLVVTPGLPDPVPSTVAVSPAPGTPAGFQFPAVL